MTKVTDFKSLRLRVASPEEILAWSYGEVVKPETINYRTQKPEKDGLFSERIFGPTKDFECYCGKYKRIRYKGVICDKCGVEVTRASVRRERTGHITLAAPVAHIWFLRGVPSRIGLMLDIPLPQVERVIYYAGYIVIHVDESAKKQVLEEVEKEYQQKVKRLKQSAPGKKREHDRKRLEEAFKATKEELAGIRIRKVLTEAEYHRLSLRYGAIFEASTGAEPIRKFLVETDLKALARSLREELREAQLQSRKKIMKRLKLVLSILRATVRPEWFFITVLPVLPPDLRPMVQLDGGRYASSDLNDLYRRVINRNNRLKRLLELRAPDVIIRNEKRMLQEAVDALVDNAARRGQATQTAMAAQRRPLKSLADFLRGKQGRFRQNLLGKRVDYSGRSVIVIGPELKLHECGLPKRMALEVFKPFVIHELLKREIAHNIRGASRMIEETPPEVWAILEEVIQGKYVLLNRAPTLHRLSVQAFQPVLIEGLAIQIPPMVCQAFNADFDGDQMAVHLPLSIEAQGEAYRLMLSARNLLKPANGEPITVPTKDIVLGIYWLMRLRPGGKGEGKVFSSVEEALVAHEHGVVALQSPIKVVNPKPLKDGKQEIIETSVGRILFNQVLPQGFPYINKDFRKRELHELIGETIQQHGLELTRDILDKLKFLGFEYATKSGLSWGMDDLVVPPEKKKMIEEAEKKVAEIQRQYHEGLLTIDERRKLVIEVWRDVNDAIAKLVPKTLDPLGPVFSIIDSGARGSWSQPSQMAGMKGLVTNPAGEIIELPVKASFKEGFNVLEYFISTHGGRKGAADTALRTASAGYLTRRLVDVAQDVVIREENCGDTKGVVLTRKDTGELGETFAQRIFSRTTMEDIKVGRKVLVRAGEMISRRVANEVDRAGVEEVRVHAPLTCRTRFGLCMKCYGYDLGHNEPVAVGEAVGIVAAQAIGEPGTQLTMRTFHTGGVASVVDITQGLPRVEEIFEVRPPKGKAPIAEVDGTVLDIVEKGTNRVIRIRAKEGEKVLGRRQKKGRGRASADTRIVEYLLSPQVALWVKKGDRVRQGTQLAEGNLDLKELLIVSGRVATQNYILKEVKKIYNTAGEAIHDKHIEV
ncbi:MAG: DNA-directed RNA polymerase subunit beta', partial [Parcubacteria group bacterium]|nr:DNA-directed RNA polymerase subunit beta' [Parcubacteria group bacterium]